MSKIKSADAAKEEGIYSEYFKHTVEYQGIYGERTVVLMQVGSFFEVYGVKCSRSDQLIESQIVEFSDVCQLNIGEKKACFGKKGQIVMAGFNLYLLDKYLPKLTDAYFTVVVFVQEKEAKKDGTYNRVFHRTYSPGTFLTCDTDSSPQITNNIMCIWMHLSKPLLISNENNLSKIRETLNYGVSVINIFTGKSFIFERRTPFYMNNTTFDELERYVSIYSPSEVLFLSPFENNDIQKIIQFIGLKTQVIHKYDVRNDADKKVVNCTNQKYIKKILSSFYNDETYDICSEFRENIFATQSFCYLLNFVQEHNPDLVRKIAIPLFNNTSDRLVLANHTLMQLNIIDEGTMNNKNVGQLSSVLSFLNKCCSPIGKRFFQYQLTNPTFDEDWLNQEYEMISQMLLPDNYSMVDAFRKLLTKVRDVEKICRQVVLRKIYPSSLAHLYKTVENIKQINTCLYELPEICIYLCSEIEGIDKNANGYIERICTNINDFLQKNLNIEFCAKTSSMTTFELNVIQKGVSVALDAAIDEYEKANSTFLAFHRFLNQLMQTHEKSPDTDYIKVHETSKSAVSLQITSKRSKTLQTCLNTYPCVTNGVATLGNNVTINLTEIRFKNISSSSANVEIDSVELSQICKKMFHLKDSINTLITDAYLKVLDELETSLLSDIEKIIKYIGKIDSLQCKTYLAKQYNYCRPQIKSDSEKSFVNTSGLRHCLIEHLQQNEIYVTNDIGLGKNIDGVLLYGTNAVGKTSLIRALGISVIMAQSGLYVPSSEFVYKPYTAIYSRILGNDNIFKGLSTFAVEMSELRIILKMADSNSLILGDELCSGTETESALSIFLAGLIILDKKKSSFIFATHFHEIVDLDEMKNLNNIALKHMAVSYDREKDCLIYDRKLKDGSGPKTYGLEVCKSLYLDEEFLELAYSIRNKYYPDSRGDLSHPSTVYNSRKIRGTCEICNKSIGEETHHLQQQKDADINGFIGSFHKNHPANLASICESCHDEIHKNDNKEKKVVRKKTTKGYSIM